MAPRPLSLGHAVVTALCALVALGLFALLFLGIFWTPGLLLGLFAAAFAADSRTLSQAHALERRRSDIRRAVRSYRAGWLDSPARFS